MFKKVLALSLLLCLLFTACSGNTQSSPVANTASATPAAQSTTPAATPTPSPSAEPVKEPSGSIRIGMLQGMTGDFGGNDYFGVGSDDTTMFRLMVRGCQITEIDMNGQYQLNDSVIDKMEVTENADGSRTFTMTVKEGLKYSDGVAITAADYVARVLYCNSPAFGEAGGYITLGSDYVGYKEYSEGTSEKFAGIRLLDDYNFSITVLADKFPDFEQFRFLERVFPLPLGHWTDGSFSIVDSEEGASFNKPLKLADIESYIKKERYTPTYSCAAYQFVSWDANAKIAVCKVNPNYPGNYEGQKPEIAEVIFKDVYGATYTDELRTGAIDMVNTVGKGTDINALMDDVDEGTLDYCGYPSTTVQGFLTRCDFGPTQFVEVRQAICYALNREELSQQMTQGFGSMVNGYYTSALWMYTESADVLETKLNPYNYSLDAAEQALIDGGWIYNKDGGEFKKGTDEVRYKKLDDGSLMECRVKAVGTPTSVFCEIAFAMAAENFPQIGMAFEFSKLEWSVCLQYIYRELEPTYHIIASGLGFGAGAFNQTQEYTMDQKLLDQGYNGSYMVDEELYNLAVKILKTEPGDEETYVKNFVDFQVRWNYLQPRVAIYSPDYYDFFTPRLKNFQNNSLAALPQALLYAYME